MKFSIIITYFNTHINLFTKCIESVIKQSYQDIEIIIVDDGSTLDNHNFLLPYASYNNVKIIYKINGGVSSARNAGLKNAKGDYIIFLDADDFLQEDSCQIFADILKLKKYDIIVSKCWIHQYGNKYENHNFYNTNMEILNKSELIDSIFINKSSKFSCVDVVWAKCYNRNFLMLNALFFNETLYNQGEDGFFNCKAFFFAKNIFYTTDKTYNYVYNKNSICRNVDYTLVFKSYKLINEYTKLFQELGIKPLKSFDFFIIRLICRILRKVLKFYNYCDFKTKLSDLIRKDYLYKSIPHIQYKNLDVNKKIVLFMIKHKKYFLLFSLLKLGFNPI